MEIDKTIGKLVENGLISVKSEKLESTYKLLELENLNKDNITVQYNAKGIVSIYYKNSQFYDESDEVLLEVLESLARERIIPLIDADDNVYYSVKLSGGNVQNPERIDKHSDYGKL